MSKCIVGLIAACIVVTNVGDAVAASQTATPFRPVGIAATDTPLATALSVIEQRPALVDHADVNELVPLNQSSGLGGTTIVRLGQELHGVPVLGGEVVVVVDAKRRVLGASGETLAGASPSIGPSISANQARQIALDVLAKSLGAGLAAADPTLMIYDAAIVGGPGPSTPVLTWQVIITRADGTNSHLYVDAWNGEIVQEMDQQKTALSRGVCNADQLVRYVPCLLVNYATIPSLNAEVTAADTFSGETYNFYLALGRDSIDGLGMPIISTVRYCPTLALADCPYQNAFWNGHQMVYGTGFAAADDVVAHELTHGVTQYTSDLLYWYESGAISEAMSDIMGEFVDLANPGSGLTADTLANRWLMGEDLTGLGPFRNLKDPPAYGNPDRVGSPNFWSTLGDNGGVHSNSGIINKTAYLIADGATFNGQTVTGIGLTKSALLWYATELALRFSSGYADLAGTLDQSCAGLVSLGAYGFVADDCAQVAKATTATALRTPAANVSPPVAVCSTGTPVDAFNDTFAAGYSLAWIATTTGTQVWYTSADTSPDGVNMHWPTNTSTNIRGYEPAVRTDAALAMAAGVAIPAGAYLRFHHSYTFEGSYDGGVVEYSSDGGAWTDISGLPATNGYNGSIATAYDNPLPGRAAFVASSIGPRNTQYDLSTLADHTVRFRFRIGTDTGGTATGWYINDVRIFSCSAEAVSPVIVPPVIVPVAVPARPAKPRSVDWRSATATGTVVAAFPAIAGTTYRISATFRSRTKIIKGVCRLRDGTATCRVKLRKGRWVIAITPYRQGVAGTPAIKVHRVR